MSEGLEHDTLFYSATGERLQAQEAAWDDLQQGQRRALQTLVDDFIRHRLDYLTAGLGTDGSLTCELRKLPSAEVMVLLRRRAAPASETEARILDFQKHSASFLNHLLDEPVGEKFYDVALQHALNIIPDAQAGSILRRASDGRFHFVASVGFNVEELGQVSFSEREVYFSFDEQLSSFVIPEIDKVNIELDSRRNAILRRAGMAEEILSTLVVPLKVQGKAAAFFTLDSFESRRAFTPDDQRMAELFGVHVAFVMRLVDLNTLFKQVFYSASHAMVIAKADFTLLGVNEAFMEMTGLGGVGTSLRDTPLLLPTDMAVLGGLAPGDRYTWASDLRPEAGGGRCYLDVRYVVLGEPLYLIRLSPAEGFDERDTQATLDGLREAINLIYTTSRRARYVLRQNDHGNGVTLDSLSNREQVLLSHLKRGLSAAESGAILNLAPRTVNNNRTALYAKLKVKGALQAARWAEEEGVK